VDRDSSGDRSVERYVGRRIRERRTLLGLTQQQLAELIGVTYQQAHKYERGINRISAGRLHALARVLGVDVNYFFEGIEAPEPETMNERQRLSLDVARNFSRIRNDRCRDAFAQLCRAMADEDEQRRADRKD
jgi:transcriptional regulator with XRE-family HTH domain